MPTIRISDKSWQRLKAWAEPLEDTADSALVKVLDAAELGRGIQHEKTASHTPRSRGSGRRRPKTPQDAFREPLLHVLYERGGTGRPKDLHLPMKQRMRDQLIADDSNTSSRAAKGGGNPSTGRALTWFRTVFFGTIRHMAFGPCPRRGSAQSKAGEGILRQFRRSPPRHAGCWGRFRLRSLVVVTRNVRHIAPTGARCVDPFG